MPTAKGWSRRFDDPIALPDGREFVTLHDAGNYITTLAKAEHEAPERMDYGYQIGGLLEQNRSAIQSFEADD